MTDSIPKRLKNSSLRVTLKPKKWKLFKKENKLKRKEVYSNHRNIVKIKKSIIILLKSKKISLRIKVEFGYPKLDHQEEMP